ncbi:hypothetical protein [Parvularcula oceani]|uniref:hypothetical protein n=1 Tax=Parvularcula oceani TaxID=1247963 RepID=UPI0004E2383F|nr:hypothetical protein [Parvularcula oceani]
MKGKLLLSGGAMALAALGVSAERRSAEAVPFLPPVLTAQSLCGPDGIAKRQAYFLRMARAYAGDDEKKPAVASLRPDTIEPLARKITTEHEVAQEGFDLGLAYMIGFNHGEAIQAFRAAQEADPGCAMCYWGEALALGPHINAQMPPEDGERAYAALQEAERLASGASEKERQLIAALATRYAQDPAAERAPLDGAYADAMDRVARAYPEDDLIAVLAAEANMDTQPWDYWAANGREPKGRTARTLELLETVLARNPDYTPAIHLYIHAVEASTDPDRAATHADRLAELATDLGHLVHMPTHIYYRLGRWEQSLDRNIDAVAADEAYMAATDVGDLYAYGYYPHNVHFALTSAQMAGAKKDGMKMAEKLDAVVPIEMAATIPLAQPIKAAPIFAVVQFGDPGAMLALEDPGDAAPLVKGAWHYARGEGYARSGEPEKAMAEARKIAALAGRPETRALIEADVPGPDILRIAELTVKARAHAAGGDYAAAIPLMEEAAELQESLPYMEPPYWYYPAKQTLAAMVLQAGEHERAERLFLASLAESPNNAWALAGLHETYKASGDRAAARYARALFKEAWMGGRRGPDLEAL